MSKMRRSILAVLAAGLGLVLLVTLAAAGAALPAVESNPLLRTPTPVPTPSGGLVINPSFESPFACPGAANCTAHGWNSWWTTLPDCQPWFPGCWVPCPSNCFDPVKRKCVKDWGCYWQQPEFAEATLQYPYRVHSGASAQKAFTYGRMGEYGLWQQVPVTRGQWLQFSVWLETWQCFNYDVCSGGQVSDLPATMNLKVGIDPTGGTTPTSTNIIWSQTGNSFDAYAVFSVTAPALSDAVTVWVYTRPAWDFARTNNDIYVDDARLEVIDAHTTYVPVWMAP